MKIRPSSFIYICWLLATTSTLGSLFFSEVMEFPPCVLCWYQRIAMYPLTLILWIGASIDFNTTYRFSIPFAMLGLLISTYHNLLHYGVIPEEASPCREGVSCATVYIELFGFLTIPLMSLIAFSLITLILLLIKKRQSYEK